MSNEAETQYNPQCGVRRTIFSDEYDFLTKIESVCAKEDGIHFFVRTWKDRIATVRITFLTPSVFRFVMVPEMTAKSHRQTVVEDVPESEFETKNAEFTENEDLYIYETNQLSLHFSKNYWEMSIYQNGKLLTKEQAFDTNVDNRWKQLPTGFRVDASGKSIASFEQFVLFSDEQFWGFGEKFTHFNKRGQRIECWQKDALSTNTEDSYKSHPYFTSSRGYSVLLNTFTRSSFDMGASSWISYQMGSDDPILDYIFLAEESKDYKKLLQQYLQITGQIPMIPKWAFGFWMSKCSYMSHEIRTPLNAIVGFSNMLPHVENREEMSEYADLIETNTDLLLQLINDILDLSKIEAGTFDFYPSSIDVNQTMEEIEQSMQLRLKNSDVTLAFTERLPGCLFYIDKNRLIQLLANFVNNAIKFTQTGTICMGYRMTDTDTI